MAIPVKHYPQVYFEDVDVGAVIPPHSITFDTRKMAMFSSICADFFPSHFDTRWATEKSHHPAAIAHGLHLNCELSQMLTNWIGPNGMLKKLRVENRALTFDRDVVTFNGAVTGKHLVNGQNCLECDIRGQKADGTLVVKGTATVELPSRG